MADAAPSTWDVELPDGTTVQDIPAGTTKAQLADKLSKNGFHVPDEWMGAKPGPDTPAYSAEGLPKPMPAWQGVGKELSGVADQLGLTPLIQSLQAPGQSHAQRLRAAMARQGPLPGQPTPAETYADMGRGVVGGLADIAGTPAAALNALWSPEGGIPGLMAHAGPQALKQDIGAIAQPQTSAGRTIEAGTNLVAPMAIPPVARGLASVATPTGWRAAEARMAAREAAAGLPAAGTGSTPPPMPPRPGMPPAPGGVGGFGADTASAARAGLVTPDMSPELQQAITAAGPDANPRVANLHAKAERMGVRLTPGDVTGDPTMRREEQDNANIIPGLRDQKLANVAAIRNRIQQLRDQVAPDSPPSTDGKGQNVAHSVMGEYGNVTGADEAAETQAWQHFRDISGDALPIDARATAEAIEARLEAAQSGAAPSMRKNAPDAAFTQPQLARLRQVADAQQRVEEATAAGKTPDPADVELATVRGQDWMAWRKAANRQMRGAPDEKTFAAGVVKNSLDNPIFTQGAQQNPEIMNAGQQAVAASRYIRQRMEADPAYAATVNGVAESTTFMRHANTENGIHAMQESLLGPNYQSTQGVEDIGAHHLDELARSGSLEPDQTGVLSTTKFNNLLRNRQSVIRAAVGETAANELEDVRDVARTITPSPAMTGENTSRTAAALREAERNRTTGMLGSIPGVGPYISKGAGAVAENQRIAELRAQLVQENAIAARTMTPFGGLGYQERAVPQGSTLNIPRRGDALTGNLTPAPALKVPPRGAPPAPMPPPAPGTPPPPPPPSGTGAYTFGASPPAAAGAPEPPPGSTPPAGTGTPVQRLGANVEALRARFRPPLQGNLTPTVQALEEQAEIARRGVDAARTPEEAAELARRGVAAQAQAEIANDRVQRGRSTRASRAAQQDTGVDLSGSEPPTPSSRAQIPTARAPNAPPPMPPPIPQTAHVVPATPEQFQALRQILQGGWTGGTDMAELARIDREVRARNAAARGNAPAAPLPPMPFKLPPAPKLKPKPKNP